MATDILIKAYETFLTYVDEEGSIQSGAENSRALTVTDDLYYAQVFLARTDKLKRVFFLAKVNDTTTGGSVIEALDNLIVEIYEVTGDGVNQDFDVSSTRLTRITGPFEALPRGDMEDGSSYADDGVYWYQKKFASEIDINEGSYYAVVFRSNISDSDYAPKIYYSFDKYRQDVFPQMLASDDSGVSYSNELIETESTGDSTRIGGVCFGYTGNQLDGSQNFDSGTITVGGDISARRNYPTYIFVENTSTQTGASNLVSIDFNMSPPDSDDDGTSEETDQMSMKWYYYQESTLPLNENSLLKKISEAKPVLNRSKKFVIFTQPDRFPPYPKVFFEENEVNLQHNLLEINPFYFSSDEGRAVMPISEGDDVVKDNTDVFTLRSWAHLANKRYYFPPIAEGTEDRVPDQSVNPSYIDFTLENTEQEVLELTSIELPQVSASNTDRKNIRGFDNIVEYKSKYIAFGKYQTESAIWYSEAPLGQTAGTRPFRAYIVDKGSVKDTDSWESYEVRFSAQSSADILNWGEAEAEQSRIIGVHDVSVQNAWDGTLDANGNKNKKETLIVIFQVYPYHVEEVPQKPYFVVAYTQEEWADNSGYLSLTPVDCENVDIYDARFDPKTSQDGIASNTTPIRETVYPRVDADYQGAKFIIPNTGNNIYFTARNPRGAYPKGQAESKFGVWKINLDSNITATTELSLVKTSGYNSGIFVNRGFHASYGHEVEISNVLVVGNTTYFGTSNYELDLSESGFNDTDAGYGYSYGYGFGFYPNSAFRMGEVYSTRDFVAFEKILGGNLTVSANPWLESQGLLVDEMFDTDGTNVTGVNYFDAISATERSNTYSQTINHVPNDRISFMAKVGDILHVWMSPSTHSLANTPFHVAHDLSISSTKLLRKFPITNFTKDTFYQDNHDDGPTSNLFNFNRSKYIRTFTDGIVNGYSIMLQGLEGRGEELTRYTISSVVEVDLDEDNPVPSRLITMDTSLSNPVQDGISDGSGGEPSHFVYIYDNSNDEITGGPFRIISVTSTSITYEIDNEDYQGDGSIYGSGGIVVITKDSFREGEAGLRWIVYDTRVINKAFEAEGGDFSKLYSGYVVKDNLDADSLILAPVGVYNAVSEADHLYYKSDPIYDRYPALNVTEDTPRRSVYCGIVTHADSYLVGDHPEIREDIVVNAGNLPEYFGFYHSSSVFNDVSNINARLINQSGVTYMVCDNGFYNESDGSKIGQGFQIYKTYGMKQNAEKWGGGIEADPDGIPNSGDEYIVTNDLDIPIGIRGVQGASSYENKAETVKVSQTDQVTFITSMKADHYADNSTYIGRNWVNVDEPNRYILALSNGFDLPQSFSFYYKLHPLTLPPGDSELDLFANPSTSQTQLVLKWARTREELYETQNEIRIPIAQDISSMEIEDADKVFYSGSFPYDIGAGFFRLESAKLSTNTYTGGVTDANGNVQEYNYDQLPKAEVLVKGLRFYDVDFDPPSGTVPSAEKAVAIAGIVHGGSISGILTDPSAIIGEGTGGTFLSPGGEIIISFPKALFVNEVSFKATYGGGGSASQTRFLVQTLPVYDSGRFGANTASEDEWESASSPIIISNSNTSSEVQIRKDNVRRFTRSIRIKMLSGVIQKISDLQIKTFAEEDPDIFESGPAAGDVVNANFIVVDDSRGLILGDENEEAVAFATFTKKDSYVIVDLGEPDDGVSGYPINRLSLNVAGAESTRTISIDVWDGVTLNEGNPNWENLKTGQAINYQYSIVKWQPREKAKSDQVEIEVVDAETVGLSDFWSTYASDFSANFDNLSGYVFRPNVDRDRNITIISSQDDSGLIGEGAGGFNPDGLIYVNAQMDSDGPFSGDIAQGVGVIERNMTFDFALRQVRKIRIRIRNSGDTNVRINGLKAYSPLIDGEGDPIWPKTQATWPIELSASTST